MERLVSALVVAGACLVAFFLAGVAGLVLGLIDILTGGAAAAHLWAFFISAVCGGCAAGAAVGLFWPARGPLLALVPGAWYGHMLLLNPWMASYWLFWAQVTVAIVASVGTWLVVQGKRHHTRPVPQNLEPT